MDECKTLRDYICKDHLGTDIRKQYFQIIFVVTSAEKMFNKSMHSENTISTNIMSFIYKTSHACNNIFA